MNGMDTVIAIRRQGLKPAAVFVQLVDKPRKTPALDSNGTVRVELLPRDSLTEADFRPLVGLHVCVEDFTCNEARHRLTAVQIAKQRPAVLWMPCHTNHGLALHIRRQGEPSTSETHVL